jgi:hypothetical protein
MLKKFEENDVFVNRVKAYPRVRVFTYSGSMYYNNNSTSSDGVKLYDFLMEPSGSGGPVVPPTTMTTEDGIYLLTEDGEFIILE